MMNEEDYIIVRKDIFTRYGASKSIILQTLIDLGGSFEGSLYHFSRLIDTISRTTVKARILELCHEGVVEMKPVLGNVYNISINMERCNKEAQYVFKNFNKEGKERAFPREVMYHLQRIKEIREEKMKKICKEMEM